MANWRKLITKRMKNNNDNWDNKEYLFIGDGTDESLLDIEFDRSYGSIHGIPFTLWTKDYVYFPVCYDGKELVGIVPRNPKYFATYHIGGG